VAGLADVLAPRTPRRGVTPATEWVTYPETALSSEDRSDRDHVPGDAQGLEGGPHPGGGEADQQGEVDPQGEGGPGAQDQALPAQTAPSPVWEADLVLSLNLLMTKMVKRRNEKVSKRK